jgi:hypothetical protein
VWPRWISASRVPPVRKRKLGGIASDDGHSFADADTRTWTSAGLPVPDGTASDFFIIENTTENTRFHRLNR